MSSLVRIISTLLSGALVACAGVKPANLKDATTSRVIELPAPYVYERHFSISSNRFRFSIAAGAYVPLYEDAGGTYFRGPPGCFRQELVESGMANNPFLHKPEVSECGIYFRDGATPRIFVYIGSGRQAPSGDVDPGVATTIALQASPTASPLQAGAGTAVAVGLIAAVVEAEKGNVAIVRREPLDDSLKDAIRFK